MCACAVSPSPSGRSLRSVARLNSSGSLDTGFNPGAGANSTVYSVALQPDGKAITVGDFTSVNGVSRNRIARLNADGSLDVSFNPGTGASNTLYSVAVQPDGRVAIGGDFVGINGVNLSRIALLHPDGSVDTRFSPGGGGLNGTVSSAALQGDGRLLIGGGFTSVKKSMQPY